MKKFIIIESKRKHRYFSINFDFDEDIVKDVRKIPTAKYNSKYRNWTALVSPSTAQGIYGLITKHKFDCVPEVLDEIESIIETKDRLIRLSRADSANLDLPDFPEGLKPYPYQKAGAKYMIEAKKCFNGDEMGLGKTIQVILAMEATNAYPHIIISPVSVLKKWRKELHKWLPHRSSVILNDNNFYYNQDILLINYESVTRFLALEDRSNAERVKYRVMEHIKRQNIKGLTLDECHYTKNSKSKRTKAIKELAKIPEYIWMLSGTIIENRPDEFIPQLQILDRLNDFGGYQNFINSYCDAKLTMNGAKDTSGSKNLTGLNEKLRKTCMIRRLKSEVLQELPTKKSIKIPVTLSDFDSYEEAENNIDQFLHDKKQKRLSGGFDFDEEMNYNGTKKRFIKNAIELEIINALKILAVRGKMNFIKEWIRKFTKKEKLIVFANHIEIQNQLIKEFPRCLRVLGNMSREERVRNQDLFQDKEQHKLIICSLKAANAGIDLFASSNVLFAELGWTPSIHDQAIARSHRIGQTKDVTGYYMVANNTIEEDIYDLLEAKREVVDSSLNGCSESYDESILDNLIKRLKRKGVLNEEVNV